MPRLPRSTLFPYTTLFRSSERMVTIKQQLAEPEKLISERQRVELIQELRYLMRITLESPTTLARLAERTLEQRKLRSEEHTSELQSPCNLVCRLLLEKKQP